MPSKLAGRVGAEVFVCAKRELSRNVVDDARRAGLAVYVYTLNSISNASKMMEMGVDGILSDSADEIVHHVKKPGV
jgi:glycerophosphoryl diester phosphodiesterase